MFWVTSFVATIALMIWIPDRLKFVIADVDLGFQVIMRAFAGLIFAVPVMLALLKFVEWEEIRKRSSLEAGFFWLLVGSLVMTGGMGLGWMTW